MSLAHRDRELALPASVQLAEAGVAVALRIALNVFVPEDRQRDVLALELAMNARPVWFDLTTVTLLRAGVGEELGLEHGIGHFLGQRPAQAGSLEAVNRRPDCRRRHANSTGDLTDRYATNEFQPKNFAHLAHGGSLCWHPVPPLEQPKEQDLSRPAEATHPGRDHPGIVGDIISERRARSSRNGGRSGIVGSFLSESAAGPRCNARTGIVAAISGPQPWLPLDIP
jgi:hypothetical protein